MKANSLLRGGESLSPALCVWSLLVTVAIAVAALAPARAAETTPQTGEAKAKMEAARQEVAAVRSNIVLTLEQLDLIRHTNNPQAQFQQFCTQLTNMEEQVQIIRARARTMKERGDAYFAAWETRTAEIQDPQMRRWAESRYTVRKQSYDRIIHYMQQARAEFTPLLDELKQIKTLLEGTRDPARITAAKDLFMRANWHCVDLQRSLMQVEAEFTFLASDFALNEKPSS